MSDRIAVMNDGRIDKIATPQEVYETPTTVQASIANSGEPAPHSPGHRVLVHLPQHALPLLDASNGEVAPASTTA